MRQTRSLPKHYKTHRGKAQHPFITALQLSAPSLARCQLPLRGYPTSSSCIYQCHGKALPKCQQLLFHTGMGQSIRLLGDAGFQLFEVTTAHLVPNTTRALHKAIENGREWFGLEDHLAQGEWTSNPHQQSQHISSTPAFLKLMT